jgi:hypothetical protein
MPTVRVEAQLSSEELLKAVQQLDPSALDQFLAQVFTLWAQRQVPALSALEKKLLRTINEGLPQKLRQPYEELIARRDAKTLSPEQHKELLRLTEEVEDVQAKRVAAMVQLARRRNRSLEQLLEDLGLVSPADE